MSSVTDISAPIQSDRCKPQADLLIALRNDNYAEFECILKNCGKRIDVNYLYEGPDYKTLLEIACSCKRKWKFVGRLLESGAIVNSLNKMHGKSPIHLVVLYSDYETLKLLVENPGIDINFPDREGNTVLHYAVQLDDREMITLLLDNGAHIGVRNSNGDPAVKFMSASTLEYLLDRSISTRGQLLEKDYQIIFDYSLLVCKQETADLPVVEETELLAAVSEVPELGPLLKHPVLTSFLDLKWQNVTSGLYWRMLLIHTLLSITVTAHIMLVYVPVTMLLTSNEGALFSGPFGWDVERDTRVRKYAAWRWLALVCISFILFREVLQLLFYSKCKYYSEWENYLKVAWIGVTYTMLVYENECEDYRNIFAALTTFLSYIELMLLISQHPVVSISVDQFKKMIRSYTKLMTWYAAFILAFVISFYILFTEKDGESYARYSFSNVTVTLIMLAFKTPDIWTGEFSFHYVWLGIYFFFVTVTLFGLLNVVSMTNALTINAERVKFVSQAKFIINVEKSAPDLISLVSALTDCYPALIERRLKRRQAPARDSKHYSATFCSPSVVERKVFVFANQRNRIVAKNMKFRNEDVDESSCCCFAKTWCFSKSSIEGAKNILSKRSSQQKCIGDCSPKGIGDGGHKGVDEVVQAVAKLQNRLAALEKALKKSEEREQTFVETTIKRTSLEDQVRFESLMKTTEERLQNAVKDASKGAVAEIRTFLEEIVPQTKRDADYFYST